MKIKKEFMIIFLFLLALPFLFSDQTNQPTQQYNKIYLNPFYRLSSTASTNFTYNLTINPPDRVSSISSALITFQVYLNPTVNFNIFVNGIKCNTPTYQVSTTYAGAGQAQVMFDCSNIITSAGNYSVTLNTDKNTGAINGWVDIDYTNNPSGNIKIGGTEYSPGDQATLWVQLIDNYGNAVNNGNCYIDIYYPLTNGIHPYQIENAPMINIFSTNNQTDDGMYYYDLIAPNQPGVYMLSARCAYAYNYVSIYPQTESVLFPTEQINTGTFQGSSFVLNSKSDGLYERCDGTIANPCSANYTFNISAYGQIENITNINMYFAGESDTALRTLVVSYWNSTAFVNLQNNLTWSGTGGSTPTGYDEYLTNSVPLSSIINNTIKLKLTTAGSARTFENWLSLSVSTQLGAIQTVKGSNEMHVNNPTGLTYIPILTSMTAPTTVNYPGFVNYSYYTGIFTANFSIASSIDTNQNITISYAPFNSLPCNSVLAVYQVLANGSLQNLSFVTSNVPNGATASSNGNYCQIQFIQSLIPQTTFNFLSIARNSWESDIRSTNTAQNAIYPLLEAGCNYWAIANNLTPYPYIVPKNQSNVGKDYFYRSCANYYDDFYWFNQTYNTQINQRPNITNSISFNQYEADYYSTKFAEDKLNSIEQILNSELQSTGMYSQILLLNPLGQTDLSGIQFFANVSSPQLLLYQGASNAINYSKGADAVWQYNQTINSNILVQFASNIWNYVSRYVHGIISS